jgi:hypothetical protein
MPSDPFAVPLIPLMPLPAPALAQHAAMWARLRWLAAG